MIFWSFWIHFDLDQYTCPDSRNNISSFSNATMIQFCKQAGIKIKRLLVTFWSWSVHLFCHQDNNSSPNNATEIQFCKQIHLSKSVVTGLTNEVSIHTLHFLRNYWSLQCSVACIIISLIFRNFYKINWILCVRHVHYQFFQRKNFSSEISHYFMLDLSGKLINNINVLINFITIVFYFNIIIWWLCLLF